MAKRKFNKKNKRKERPFKYFLFRPFRFLHLPWEVRSRIFSVLMFLMSVLVVLSFFDAAGIAGRLLKRGLIFLVGDIYFLLPLFFALGGVVFWRGRVKNNWQIWSIILLFTCGGAGFLRVFEFRENFENFIFTSTGRGGWIGNILGWPLFKLFGFWVSLLLFGAMIIIGGLIAWHFLRISDEEKKEMKVKKEKPVVIKEIFKPKFKVERIEKEKVQPFSEKKTEISQISSPPLSLPTHRLTFPFKEKDYPFPPLDLLEKDRGGSAAGDIKVNSAIIKRTLQNFGIQVEMAEINIGPTVTQYALRPAAGIKLSKITSLANDLSLALAAHPIRIEAPIPGRSLIGIEVPNKVRAVVRLKNLLEHPTFQNSISPLTIALGRDVRGNPFFADLARMPHLLVGGSTGSGKTVCLNCIILSLLYQNSPQILRLVLIDPKRVEFPIYNGLPHLLVPAIVNVQKTVNTLQWLNQEMERRFEVLSTRKARDIISFNEKVIKEGLEPMPYIVVIIDELADLMAARGREIEAGIVRLAQMARAVGIHLVVATQRPSVEVITGLIKANITSRISFQVASQVDSRTILDMAGAERLLGAGDMLFISPEIPKPKRIQGAYVSEKEVKRVVNYIKSQLQKREVEEDELSKSLREEIEKPASEGSFLSGEEDPLYEEAKRVVIEARKASASLLQRRLRIGYARAARLIDMLEERGVVGPAEGAKPREVYLTREEEDEDFEQN